MSRRWLMSGRCTAHARTLSTIAMSFPGHWARSSSTTLICRSWEAYSHRPVPPTVNGFWQNESFHNYADYAMSDEFQAGLRKLQEIGHVRRCAVMCAEAVWWRCHRRIIADYLIAAGETVIHILAKGRTESAHITEAAVRAPNGALVYPLASRIVDYQRRQVGGLESGPHLRHDTQPAGDLRD